MFHAAVDLILLPLIVESLAFVLRFISRTGLAYSASAAAAHSEVVDNYGGGSSFDITLVFVETVAVMFSEGT